MAVVLGNLVVTGKVEGLDNPNARSIAPETAVERPAVQVDTTERTHTLIVNGKEKKIGKKSAYLLDMLTIDDE